MKQHNVNVVILLNQMRPSVLGVALVNVIGITRRL